MYPLFSWTYPNLCDRLDNLIKHGFYSEAAVACAQTIEQIIKRIINQHMNLLRLGVLKEKNKLKLTPINTIKERDAGLRLLQGISDLKKAWRLLLSGKEKLPPLDTIMNGIAGPNAWTILYSQKPVKVPVSSVNIKCKFGLFFLRHKLVHGTYSPRKEDIEALAEWVTETIKRLLDPINGVSSRIGWNPQHKISPFRKRKTL
jgi:hypothetical protein